MNIIKKIIHKILVWLGFKKEYQPKFETDGTPANHDVVRYDYKIQHVSFAYENPMRKEGGTLIPHILVSVNRTPIEDGVFIADKREVFNTNYYAREFALVSGEGFVVNRTEGFVSADENTGDERKAVVKMRVVVGDDEKIVTTEVIQK